jgi:hypothetical protein
MKRIFILISLLFLLTNTTHSQYKKFGLGIILGEPTGLNAKLKTSFYNSFNFAAAWSFKEDEHLLLQTDYVWYNFDLIKVESGKLPLYFGVGGRIIFFREPLVGVRVPVGLNYQFENAPIDIFAELVPVLDVLPSTKFNFAGGLGVRFWF